MFLTSYFEIFKALIYKNVIYRPANKEFYMVYKNVDLLNNISKHYD